MFSFKSKSCLNVLPLLPLLLQVAFTLALALFFTGVVGDYAEASHLRNEPDLIVSAVSAPSIVSSGTTVGISATVENQGNATSSAFSVSYYGSTSPSSISMAVLLGVQDVASLQAGDSIALVTSLTVPPSAPSGTFYLLAIADLANVVLESNENNNLGSSEAISVNGSTPPTITVGTTYYVATTGSDTNPGTETQPFRTISHGVSGLTPGDTLYITGGTYAEALLDSIPPGTSWDSPVTVAAAPGHTVTLKPNAGAGWVLHFQGPQQYIVIDGLILDGTNTTYDAVKITASGGGGPAHHIRLIRCELKNASGNGVIITQSADWNEFINLNVHDNGISGYEHGFYISTSHNVVEGSDIHDNSGYGVHIYNGHSGQRADNNIVRKNSVFANGYTDGGAGIILGSGDRNTAYNNLIWGNYAGIRVAYGAVPPTNTTVYHNTVYHNRAYGIYVHTDSRQAIIQNNLFHANGLPESQQSGVGTVFDHNLTGTDPRFVNAAAGDFRLQPGSPVIDAGVTLDTVTIDFADIARPQGAASDIGAFELVP